MLNIAIVEDEQEYADQLTGYIERFRAETHTAVRYKLFTDGMSFIDEYDGRFDIVLMDIAMPHMNGLEAAKRLREADSVVCMIFITTLSKYALKGYEVDALDFLVKPVRYELFRLKLEKALFYIGKRVSSVYSIVTATSMQKVRLADIYYIESAKHYLLFHTAQEEYKMRGTMKEINEYFVENGFAHISGSVLVNLSHVDAMRGGDVTVAGTLLPVARAYRSGFMQALTGFIGGGAR